MCKVIVYFAPFLANFWLMFKKHYKIGISAHFQKQEKRKKNHSEGLLSGPSKGYYLGPSCLQHKNGQLGPDIITLQFFAHTFFSKKALKPLLL